MTTEQKIIRAKVGLLELAKQLGSSALQKFILGEMGSSTDRVQANAIAVGAPLLLFISIVISRLECVGGVRRSGLYCRWYYSTPGSR